MFLNVTVNSVSDVKFHNFLSISIPKKKDILNIFRGCIEQTLYSSKNKKKTHKQPGK